MTSSMLIAALLCVHILVAVCQDVREHCPLGTTVAMPPFGLGSTGYGTRSLFLNDFTHMCACANSKALVPPDGTVACPFVPTPRPTAFFNQFVPPTPPPGAQSFPCAPGATLIDSGCACWDTSNPRSIFSPGTTAAACSCPPGSVLGSAGVGGCVCAGGTGLEPRGAGTCPWPCPNRLPNFWPVSGTTACVAGTFDINIGNRRGGPPNFTFANFVGGNLPPAPPPLGNEPCPWVRTISGTGQARVSPNGGCVCPSGQTLMSNLGDCGIALPPGFTGAFAASPCGSSRRGINGATHDNGTSLVCRALPSDATPPSSTCPPGSFMNAYLGCQACTSATLSACQASCPAPSVAGSKPGWSDWCFCSNGVPANANASNCAGAAPRPAAPPPVSATPLFRTVSLNLGPTPPPAVPPAPPPPPIFSGRVPPTFAPAATTTTGAPLAVVATPQPPKADSIFGNGTATTTCARLCGQLCLDNLPGQRMCCQSYLTLPAQSVLVTPNTTGTACCHSNVHTTFFSGNTTVCCGPGANPAGLPVPADIPFERANCCLPPRGGGTFELPTVFDRRKVLCCPPANYYSYATQPSLHGIAVPAEFTTPACCGPIVIDRSKSVCCYDRQVDLPAGMNATTAGCCGQQPLNNQRQVCCSGVVRNVPVGATRATTGCCAVEAYNTATHVCCKGYAVQNMATSDVVPRLPGVPLANHQCCGGFLLDRTANGTRRCCGNSLSYLTSNAICCSSVRVNNWSGARQQVSVVLQLTPSIAPSRAACCIGPTGVAAPYDVVTQDCCNGTPTQGSQVCSQGFIINVAPGVTDALSLLGTPNEGYCLLPSGRVLIDKRRHFCCGTPPMPNFFSPATAVALIPQPLRGTPSAQLACCGSSVRRVWNANTHVCCEDRTVTPNVARIVAIPAGIRRENALACCGKGQATVFENVGYSSICCVANLTFHRPSTAGLNSCCGSVSFDSSVDTCCDTGPGGLVLSGSPMSCAGVPTPPPTPYVARPGFCPPTCNNRGTCNFALGVCDCEVGWKGAACDEPSCSPPCGFGGKCVHNASISTSLCQCQEGYQIVGVEDPDDFTLKGGTCAAVCPEKCANGGKCYRPGECECPEGWSGRRCEVAVCNPPCQNNAECALPPSQCRCLPPFAGSQCSRRCEPPCQNGGRCAMADDGGLYCDCSRTFATGELCEVDLFTPPPGTECSDLVPCRQQCMVCESGKCVPVCRNSYNGCATCLDESGGDLYSCTLDGRCLSKVDLEMVERNMTIGGNDDSGADDVVSPIGDDGQDDDTAERSSVFLMPVFGEFQLWMVIAAGVGVLLMCAVCVMVILIVVRKVRARRSRGGGTRNRRSSTHSSGISLQGMSKRGSRVQSYGAWRTRRSVGRRRTMGGGPGTGTYYGNRVSSNPLQYM